MSTKISQEDLSDSKKSFVSSESVKEKEFIGEIKIDSEKTKGFSELFDESKEKPLSRFISQIINFSSFIPSTDELNEAKVYFYFYVFF